MVAVVGGVPVMVGGRLAGAVLPTVSEKAGRAAETLPSLTLITMPLVVPSEPVGGVPLTWPVAGVNVAQLGLLVISNVRVSSWASSAVGVNVYGVPTVALVPGVPMIVGAVLTGGGGGASGLITVRRNGASSECEC